MTRKKQMFFCPKTDMVQNRDAHPDACPVVVARIFYPPWGKGSGGVKVMVVIALLPNDDPRIV